MCARARRGPSRPGSRKLTVRYTAIAYFINGEMQAALLILGQERELAREAFPGCTMHLPRFERTLAATLPLRAKLRVRRLVRCACGPWRRPSRRPVVVVVPLGGAPSGDSEFIMLMERRVVFLSVLVYTCGVCS